MTKTIRLDVLTISLTNKSTKMLGSVEDKGSSIIVREPAIPLRMFSATFFSLWFSVYIYPGPSQVDRDHPQLGAVWSQGPQNPFFGACPWRNDLHAHIKVLHQHKLTKEAKIWHGVSWHIGVSSKIGFWGLLPFYYQISPTTAPETHKKYCPPNKYPSIMVIFQHFMVNITVSLVDTKLPTSISFNLSPRWPLSLENYSFCGQDSALYPIRRKLMMSQFPIDAHVKNQIMEVLAGVQRKGSKLSRITWKLCWMK